LVSYNKLGDVAEAQGKLEEAARAYGDGLGIAKKLAAGDPSNTQWQRVLYVSYIKLGDVAEAQDKLKEATRAYGDGLRIAKKLAAGDPSNTLFKRDLLVSYWKLANLAERQEKASEAQGYWKQAFDVLSGIEKQGLQLSPQDRQYLETLRRKSGAAP
jgi:tetratricopeptide (TPR) repeat protein